jgi:hypothetical protein
VSDVIRGKFIPADGFFGELDAVGVVMFAAKSEDMAITNTAIQNIASSREPLADQLENKSVDAMLAGAGGSHPLTPVLVRVLYSELSQFSFRSRLGHGDSAGQRNR